MPYRGRANNWAHNWAHNRAHNWAHYATPFSYLAARERASAE
jgi:hypothetical protein